MSFVKKWDSYKIFCLRMKISWKPGSQVLCHYPNLVLDSIQCLKTSLEAQLVLLTDCVGLGCISAKVSTLHSLLGALGFIQLAVNFWIILQIHNYKCILTRQNYFVYCISSDKYLTAKYFRAYCSSSVLKFLNAAIESLFITSLHYQHEILNIIYLFLFLSITILVIGALLNWLLLSCFARLLLRYAQLKFA